MEQPMGDHAWRARAGKSNKFDKYQYFYYYRYNQLFGNSDIIKLGNKCIYTSYIAPAPIVQISDGMDTPSKKRFDRDPDGLSDGHDHPDENMVPPVFQKKVQGPENIPLMQAKQPAKVSGIGV